MATVPPSKRWPGLLSKDCNSLEETARLLFDSRCPRREGWLDLEAIHEIFANLRQGGVSQQQVRAAMGRVCAERSECTRDEFPDLVMDLDRRYHILQGAQWEFALLDRRRTQSITEDDALFLLRAVHKDFFVLQSWQRFLLERKYPGMRVTWDEIEVPLCDIPEWAEIHTVQETEKQKAEEVRKQREADDYEENKRREESRRQQEAETAARELEERQAKEQALEMAVEEAHRREVEEERQRAREKEEKAAKRMREEEAWRLQQGERDSLEKEAANAAEREREAARLAKEAEDRAMAADSDAARIAAEEARRQAIIRAKREQHTRIKVELKQAIQLEDREKLELSVHAVKKEKVGDCGDLLAEAERLLGKLKARGSLRDAIVARRLAELERAVEQTRKGGFETDLRVEMTEARALLDKLHRLEQKRKAVLNLSQRVIAEIKSYAKPPAAVHTVLSATFLLLGTPESETKSWPATQVLIGKTGRTSLKRRVSEFSVETVPRSTAQRALHMLKNFDLDSVEEASLGCAVFYTWAEGVVEEVMQAAALQ